LFHYTQSLEIDTVIYVIAGLSSSVQFMFAMSSSVATGLVVVVVVVVVMPS